MADSGKNRHPAAIFLATVLLLLAVNAASAQSSVPPPPAVGLSERQAADRAALLTELAAAKSDAEARGIEDRLWTFWRSFADDQGRALLEQSKDAQLRFDYAEATLYLKELVKHAPQFAEGWNQLAYVYFLAGDYEDSLAAIDRVLALEPMHYAALAGKGIILMQQGKVTEAQVALKQALKIDPWLKERNLIGEDRIPEP